MGGKADVNIILTKEAMLELIGDTPETKVALEQAALNYLRNSRIKPIQLEVIRDEIKISTRGISKLIVEELAKAGYAYNGTFSLSSKIKAHIKEEAGKLIDDVITEKVEAMFEEPYADFRKKLDKCLSTYTEFIEHRMADQTMLKQISDLTVNIIKSKLKSR